MNKKAIWIIIVVLGIVVATYYVNSRGSNSNSTRTIVAILPLTGLSATHGEYSKRGIEMALADLPSSRNIIVVYEDSQMDPKAAISEFNKNLGQGDMTAVLSLGSPVAMALKPLAVTSKTVLMSIVSAPTYSSPNDYTFRINGTVDVEMESILQTIKALGIKKLAVVFQNDDYGRGLVNSLKQKFDGVLVAEEGFLPTATDMRSELTKVKSKSPDGVFVAAYAKVVGLVAKQSKELGMKTSLICGSACDNPDLLTAAGSSADSLVIVAPSPKANSIFDQKYRATYKEAPNFVSIRMYDAVKLITGAIDACTKSTDFKVCMKDNIHAVKDFPGAAFPVNFDQNGDLLDKFVTKKVVNGVLQIQE
ncbi:MAG: ABC transporter substrate-binding protein [Candidatus Taylorbacteria bacterium]|nr:ABC transporter substrate-binding protein [Candidatus Taylorbacteria bacterium]